MLNERDKKLYPADTDCDHSVFPQERQQTAVEAAAPSLTEKTDLQSDMSLPLSNSNHEAENPTSNLQTTSRLLNSSGLFSNEGSVAHVSSLTTIAKFSLRWPRCPPPVCYHHMTGNKVSSDCFGPLCLLRYFHSVLLISTLSVMCVWLNSRPPPYCMLFIFLFDWHQLLCVDTHSLGQ